MNRYRWLVLVQVAPFVVFAAVVVPLFELHRQLAVGILFSTLIFGVLGMRIKCPSCASTLKREDIQGFL